MDHLSGSSLDWISCISTSQVFNAEVNPCIHLSIYVFLFHSFLYALI